MVVGLKPNISMIVFLKKSKNSTRINRRGKKAQIAAGGIMSYLYSTRALSAS
jgi:hypothetical protein